MDDVATTSSGSSNTDSNRKDENINLAPIIPIPPDGGWGWIIVAVCSVGNLSIDAMSVSFPSIQNHLSVVLNKSLTEISFIISLYNCICYIIGPLSGAVANRFGFRLTMLAGASVAFLATFASYFIIDFIALLFFYGFFAGLGGSLVYMTSMAAPGFWFEEKRALAAGISSCASGLAAIFIPIIAASIEHYDWKSVIFIPAGMFLILSLLSSLIRKTPTVYIQPKKHGFFRRRPTDELFTPTSVVSLLGGGAPSQRKLTQISQHVGLRKHQIKDIPAAIVTPSKRRRCNCCKNDQTIERPIYRKDVFYQGSVTRIREMHQMLPGEYTVSIHRIPTLRDVREEIECRCTLCPEAMRKGIKAFFDYTVFTNKSFVMIFFSTFFFYNGIYIPFLYLKRVNMENKLEEKYANLLVPLFGTGVTLSRCTIGLVMLIFPRIGSHNITVLSLAVSALFSFLLTLQFNVIYQITMNIIFGYSAGLYLPMRSVILIDYIGLEKLTSAMGFIFTIQGIGSLSGIPIAEILMTYFQDARWSLFYGGIVFFISMVFLTPIYFFKPHVKHLNA